ncbi:PREDICTED: serendipity locus protein H-1-like [Priapulus caudatus]|uniref:Serendipity locus protein H-1-like n=1 Tax=Priapulus caudatus TaxID=37621 RepID=A0ABM1F2Q1_PRICU|nr:PREDICTED: serendipity locus protein H-1-like [Priapulus caudatus]
MRLSEGDTTPQKGLLENGNMAALTLVNNNVNAMNFTENQHGNVILERLKQQKDAGRFCDVVLHVQGRQYQAHRNVLAACSPYFDSILKVHHIVKEQLTITCQNHEVFQLLLNYMYTGNVVIDKHNVSELLKLANHFLVSKLKSYCAEYLDRYLDVTNCLSVKELAEKYNMPALVKNATHFLHSNVAEILEHGEVLALAAPKIETLLSDKNVVVDQERLIRFIVRWIKHDVGTRDRDIRALLALVSWKRVPDGFVVRQLERDPLFKESPRCLFMTLQALRENGLPLGKYENLLVALEENCGVDLQHCDNDVFINLAVSAAVAGGGVKVRKDENNVNNNANKKFESSAAAVQTNGWPQRNLNNNSLVKESQTRANGSQSPHRRKNVTPIKLRIAKQQALQQQQQQQQQQQHGSTPKRKPGRPRKTTATDDSLKHKKITKNNHQLEDVESPPEDEHHHEILVNGRGPGSDYDDAPDDELSDNSSLSLDEVGKPRKKRMKFNDGLENGGGKDGMKCPDCCYMAHNQTRLDQHRDKAHSRNTVYHCSICDFDCKWNREYYMHMKTHFSGPPFKCDQCDYSTDRIQPILSHRMKHTDEKPFECTECEYRCRTKNNLTAHMRSHTGEKPFRCDECGRCFAIKSTLDQHLVTHSDDRPYLCDTCGFSTKYQSHLIAHKRIHTGDVYTCQYPKCTYSSPKKSQLKAHMRTHAAIRSHVCAACGRGFVEKSHLVRHERIHLEEKPFRCALCEYGSSRRDKLKEHVAKHHGDAATARAPYKARRPPPPPPAGLPASADTSPPQSLSSMGQQTSPQTSDYQFDGMEAGGGSDDAPEHKVFDQQVADVTTHVIDNISVQQMAVDMTRGSLEMAPRASIDIPRSLAMELDPRIVQQMQQQQQQQQHEMERGLSGSLAGMSQAGYPGQQCDFGGWRKPLLVSVWEAEICRVLVPNRDSGDGNIAARTSLTLPVVRDAKVEKVQSRVR